MSIYRIDGNETNTIYAVNGNILNHAYSVDGEDVYDRSGSANYDSYSIENYLSFSVANAQGFDISNGVLFQFRGSGSINNIMNTYDCTLQSAITTGITTNSQHGDSASFSDEYYDETDTYPLLYVTADTNPALVYVNRVTESSSTLVRTLSFPLDKTGYYAAACCDFENDIIYMVGYTEQNYLTDNGGSNKVNISKWDLSSLTDNGNDTYTPEYISSCERSFIYCMQGQQFHDGLMWIASGYSNHAGYIYAVRPSDGDIRHTINLNTTSEVEGLSWLDDLHMVVGYQGKNYQKVTFVTY